MSPGNQFGGAVRKIPGFELNFPSTLPHREAHVLLLHPDRLSDDFYAPRD